MRVVKRYIGWGDDGFQEFLGRQRSTTGEMLGMTLIPIIADVTFFANPFLPDRL